jgi:hypothetical protein
MSEPQKRRLDPAKLTADTANAAATQPKKQDRSKHSGGVVSLPHRQELGDQRQGKVVDINATG